MLYLMVLPYAFISMVILKKELFGDCDILPLVSWRYTDNIFMLWQHGKKEIKTFFSILNSYQLTIKFTANYSRETIIYTCYVCCTMYQYNLQSLTTSVKVDIAFTHEILFLSLHLGPLVSPKFLIPNDL